MNSIFPKKCLARIHGWGIFYFFGCVSGCVLGVFYRVYFIFFVHTLRYVKGRNS